MTDKLSIYNGALRIIGERSLASLTENREPRRILDNVWDDGLVKFCLEQDAWRFALRSSQIDADPSIEPDFGLQYGFPKPDGWVRTDAMCADPFFKDSLLDRYTDEAGIWFADVETIYVSYVSNDNAYGGDFSKWPETFAQYVQAVAAFRSAWRITQNEGKEDRAERRMKQALSDARAKDGIGAPTQAPPRGSWVGARMGNYASRRGFR